MTARAEVPLKQMRQLLELARRGEHGEKDNARNILDRLLRQYRLSEQDIDPEAREEITISYRTKMEEKLLVQVYGSTCGLKGKDLEIWSVAKNGKKQRSLAFNVTRIEGIEIRRLFDFYRKELSKELEVFMSAFVHSRRLGLTPDDDKEPAVDLARLEKLLLMAEGMDPKTPHKQLAP